MVGKAFQLLADGHGAHWLAGAVDRGYGCDTSRRDRLPTRPCRKLPAYPLARVSGSVSAAPLRLPRSAVSPLSCMA